MTSRKEKPIIEVKNLSKEYQIGVDRTYKRFTESFTNAVRHPIRTLRGLTEPKETFWALKDVNFEVERGEVLGIIGRNGAGKSTLLKVLSRITYPTEGEIVMRGRVGSLLEVGTGFHPELTGRENIYFNGAILGMKKREIDEKFDEIVKFSGVEKFLDTPVKRYSSGMQVRLAFSVAAHLDPEILLVDEVLAVGDAEFQKKCLGKMSEIAEEGRTVIFVSHNLEAVRRLCPRGILIESGEIIYDGSIEQSLERYLQEGNSRKAEFVLNEIPQNTLAWVHKVRVEDNDGVPCCSFPVGRPWKMRLFLNVKRSETNLSIGIGISKNGFGVGSTWSKPQKYNRGIYEIILSCHSISLTPGEYLLTIAISSLGGKSFILRDVVAINIDPFMDIDLSSHKMGYGIIVNPLDIEKIGWVTEYE
jgi:ABC-type polysaccharide/polyol phosphate transport system ATPase subunit